MTSCAIGWPSVAACTTDHEGFHHATSMNEVQQALREGRKVLDPDGDGVDSARIRNGQKKNAEDAIGTFKVGRFGSIPYHVAQILVEDKPFDEEVEMAKLLKSLAISVKRQS